MGGGLLMKKLLLVEVLSAELIPQEFADSWGIEEKTIWEEIQATEKDFQEYESLRLALEEKLEQIRQAN
jgi:predicted DNA-binding protein YlxM (UPF0122 family)